VGKSIFKKNIVIDCINLINLYIRGEMDINGFFINTFLCFHGTEEIIEDCCVSEELTIASGST
jgi:hypothetical protein